MSHDSSRQRPDSRPWYRQFWPWFVIALPASAVIAGITTLVIAINNADDLVAENWYRDGRAINRNLEAERLAAQLGLRATLSQSEGVIQVALAADSALPWPAQLALALRHPTLANEDIRLDLQHQGNGVYQAPLPAVSGERYISLSSEHWRLATKARMDTPIRLGASS